MSSKKEEKGVAAERIKAATISATKGMSRAQAEKAAAAATRNVNAYGQKEEGPSRWQERKELKRKMYLLSTERAVTLGVIKKDIDLTSKCQKCYQAGHWTAECKNERVYLSRPSRSQVLKNPKLGQRRTTSYSEDFPDEEEEEKEKKSIKVVKEKKKSKRKHRSDTEPSSESETSKSESDTGSDSASDDSGSSYSSSSDSEAERKRRKKTNDRKKQKERRKRYSSSSESSDYDSSSDSESNSDSRKSSRKSKKGSHKR